MLSPPVCLSNTGARLTFLEFSATSPIARRAEAKLRQQTDAMEAAIDGMALLNEKGVYVYLNKAHAKLYGYENAGELIGKSWRILYDSDELQRFEQEIMPEIGRKGNWHGEAIGKKKDGSKFPQELSLTATADGGLICVVHDITKRKQAEKALRDSEERYRELSIIDDLTQLYNSRYFYFQLKIESDRSNRYELPLTLLLLDLDNFKAFNDAYGHVEGDQVLLRLGQVVKRCLRQTDSAYRYGGEEFTIILPMTTGADGAVTAERIRTEFKKETFSPAPGQDVHMTVSIGLGAIQAPGRDEGLRTPGGPAHVSGEKERKRQGLFRVIVPRTSRLSFQPTPSPIHPTRDARPPRSRQREL